MRTSPVDHAKRINLYPLSQVANIRRRRHLNFINGVYDFTIP